MRAQEIIERGLAAMGPDGGFIVVTHESTVNLRWANSVLTTNGASQGQHVSVVAFSARGDQGASGAAVGQVRAPDDLDQLIARARATADAADPAEDWVTPDAGAADAPEQGWEVGPATASVTDLQPVTDLLADVLARPPGMAHGSGVVEHFGYAEQDLTTTYLGMGEGLRARFEIPTARFELSGKSSGRSRSAWAGRAGEWLSALDLGSTAGEVSAGLARQQRRVDLPPGRHTAILSPSAAADLLVYLYWSAGARDALDGRSALRGDGGATMVGRRVSPLPLRMHSDPRSPGMATADRVIAVESGPMSSPFDTGIPLAPTDWIAEGMLGALVTTRSTALRGGLRDTPAIDNLLVEVPGAAGTLEEVASRAGDGLLLTCLWYIREVDSPTLLLTGLTRDGVYVVRGGEIIGAAGNFRFNESPLSMLGRLSDAGAPQRCLPREWGDYFTRTSVPPMTVPEFNFSTASDAT